MSISRDRKTVSLMIGMVSRYPGHDTSCRIGLRSVCWIVYSIYSEVFNFEKQNLDSWTLFDWLGIMLCALQPFSHLFSLHVCLYSLDKGVGHGF